MDRSKKSSKKVPRRLPGRVWKRGDKEPVSGMTGEFSEEGLFFETQHPFAPDSQVKIELAFSGSTIQLEGVVAEVANDEDHLRAIQVGGMGVQIAYSPEQLEKLVAAPLPERRVKIDSAVIVSFGSDSQQLNLRDLSASGAALVGDSNLPDISLVRMIFRLEESSYPIEVDAVPVRSEETEGGTLIGMRFLDPPENVSEAIEEFIRKRT